MPTAKPSPGHVINWLTASAPSFHKAFLTSASFHAFVDTMLAVVPQIIETMASEALADEKRRVELIRQLESGRADTPQ